jgi:hypothetical protein
LTTSAQKAADWIPNAGLLIELDIGHFEFLQGRDEFSREVAHFLEKH